MWIIKDLYISPLWINAVNYKSCRFFKSNQANCDLNYLVKRLMVSIECTYRNNDMTWKVSFVP